jgi:hypothetical protein
MRINKEKEQGEIMEKDMEFFFRAFIRQYGVYNQNRLPRRLTVPKLLGLDGIEILYISLDDPLAEEIREDTRMIQQEVAEEQEKGVEDAPQDAPVDSQKIPEVAVHTEEVHPVGSEEKNSQIAIETPQGEKRKLSAREALKRIKDTNKEA